MPAQARSSTEVKPRGIQHHLNASKVQPFNEGKQGITSFGDEESARISDRSASSTRARALFSAGRACSIDSFSTLGSHRGHHHPQKPRAQSQDSHLASESKAEPDPLLQHSINNCLNTELAPVAEQHALKTCKESVVLDEKYCDHDLPNDPQAQGYAPPENHVLAACQFCPTGPGLKQHSIAECPTHSMFALNSHRLGDDATNLEPLGTTLTETRRTSDTVDAGPIQHTIHACNKCETVYRETGHRPSQCIQLPVYAGPTVHELQECASCEVLVGNGAAHRISLCPKRAVYAGPSRHSIGLDPQSLREPQADMHPIVECETLPVLGSPRVHSLQLCTLCPLGEGAPRHRMSECRRYIIPEMSEPHELSACRKCELGGDLQSHSVQNCQRYPYTGPGNGHQLDTDNQVELIQSAAAHELIGDSVFAQPRHPQHHDIVKDEKTSVANDVRTHGLHMCTQCAEHDLPTIHSLADCPYLLLQVFGETELRAPLSQTILRQRSLQQEHYPRRQTDSSHTEQFFDADSSDGEAAQQQSDFKTSQTRGPGRSQSLSSLLDYTRATQWIRGLLRYPEGYTTNLTSLPSRGAREKSDDNSHKPEAVESPNKSLARSSTGMSSHPSMPEAKVDRYQFQRAVSDLERLLGEAVTLASGFVETKADQFHPYKNPSISLHSHCHSLSPVEDTSSSQELNNAIHMRGPSVVGDRTTKPYVSASEYLPTIIPLEDANGCLVNGKHGTPKVFSVASLPNKQEAAGLPTLIVTDKRDARPCHSQPRKLNEYSDNIVDFEDYFSHHDVTASARISGPSAPAPEATPSGNVAKGAEIDKSAQAHGNHGISLRRRSHISLQGVQGFNLAKSHKRQPIARDWSPLRKRFTAAVACLSTALVGIILGIYSGIVPSIQYYIIDNAHVIVYGNTACYLGLAIPTFFCWPLPLLHGRKPYILGSMVLAMPLLFPQAIAVSTQRLEHTGPWRAMLLASRALMGVALGFASMNFHSILTDLFGASLMSTNPHQEVADAVDARRHGGGMGVWLGIWTWCWIGSLGVGFLVGAVLIDSLPPVWGFYVSIIMVAVVLLLNVISPEVRRSAYRRSIAEVRSGEDISRRLARGEIMMHRVKTGPTWWGEELYHGMLLCGEMLRQPGFFVVAVYSGWIYAQVVLLILLLGSLASNLYRYHAPGVGLLVACLSLGALLAVPFQKANLFSRSRQAQLNTNNATLENKIAWTSHLVRRAIFTTMLPFSAACYTCLSTGPPLSIAGPTAFATLVGFLSSLAISECNGLVMETFDTSDLSPGMTGRQRGYTGKISRRTNYSSFPRVTAGFAVIHSFAFVLAAGATALAGSVARSLGQQVASGVVAGTLFVFTMALLLGLVRFKEVQIVPNSKAKDMDRLSEVRRRSTLRRESTPNDPEAVREEENAWRPVMIGNPISKMRRMNIFELGAMSRWQEIRKKNKFIDEGTHLNRAAIGDGLDALDGQFNDIRAGAQDFLAIASARAKKLRRSDMSSDRSHQSVEMDDLSFKTTELGVVEPRADAVIDKGRMMAQAVTEETEDEMNAMRRRSVARGKQPEV